MDGSTGDVENRLDKILIIGAGAVGLGIARALKNRGIPYDQVDAATEIGGNWANRIYRSAHIISSKKTTAYSDYPMPESYPDFPSADQMLAYLRDYTGHFSLRDNIELERRVERLKPSADGPWIASFSDGKKRQYKGVIICNGHHWDRRWPDYPGEFAGEFMHSRDYTGAEQLAGKRVLVIGGGNSACDIASEAARVSVECHLSLRRGYWFLPKTLLGRPTVELNWPWLPVVVQRILLRILLGISVGDYRRYGLQRPDHKIFEHHPTISTEVLHYLKHGKIKPHPDIKRFNGFRVEFNDSSSVEADVLVCATGYKVSYPMLAGDIVDVRGVVPQVVGQSMLPDYRHLYLVGWSQPRYGFGPLVTEGAGLLCDVIEAQDQLRQPLGRLLWRMGERPPRSHLMNPHAMLRKIRRGRRWLPWLVRFGKFQERGIASDRHQDTVRQD
jgi:thioredoxin reductase